MTLGRGAISDPGSNSVDRAPDTLGALGRGIAAIAKSGLTYTKDPFDRERFEDLLTLSARFLGHLSGVNPDALIGLLQADPGPITPKLGVRVGVFDEQGRVLLVKERSDGLWSLPGGWIDVDFTPAEAALKEVKEETGYEIEISHFCGIFDQRKLYYNPLWHVICCYFTARVVAKHPWQQNSEIYEHGFFHYDGHPPLSTKRMREEELRLLFRWHAGEQRAPIFE